MDYLWTGGDGYDSGVLAQDWADIYECCPRSGLGVIYWSSDVLALDWG